MASTSSRSFIDVPPHKTALNVTIPPPLSSCFLRLASTYAIHSPLGDLSDDLVEAPGVLARPAMRPELLEEVAVRPDGRAQEHSIQRLTEAVPQVAEVGPCHRGASAQAVASVHHHPPPKPRLVDEGAERRYQREEALVGILHLQGQVLEPLREVAGDPRGAVHHVRDPAPPQPRKV